MGVAADPPPPMAKVPTPHEAVANVVPMAVTTAD